MADRKLTFEDLPQRPNAKQLDEIMRSVSEQLGETWTAVRLNGYWLFYKDREDGTGHQDLFQAKRGRQFIVALGEATGATVVNAISVW